MEVELKLKCKHSKPCSLLRADDAGAYCRGEVPRLPLDDMRRCPLGNWHYRGNGELKTLADIFKS